MEEKCTVPRTFPLCTRSKQLQRSMCAGMGKRSLSIAKEVSIGSAWLRLELR